MAQYATSHKVGRRGATLSVYLMNESAEIKKEWVCTYNGKGFKISLYDDESMSDKVIVKEDTFLYPDKIDEEDIDFVEAVSGPLTDQERSLIMLCSYLVAKWAAGHTEEDLMETVSKRVDSWSK